MSALPLASARFTKLWILGHWKCRSGKCGSRQWGWKSRRYNAWKLSEENY